MIFKTFFYLSAHISTRDGASTIQMYSSTSTITLNMHEYEYEENKCTSTITLECKHDYFHDYFNEYPVSNIKATFMESLGVILVLLLCH